LKMAREATQLKEQFLANTSHELRTPMNGIMGVAGLLLEMGLNEEQQQYARLVHSSSQSLLKVINSILDYSALERREVVQKRVDFDLLLVLQDALRAVTRAASDKGLVLDYAIEAGTPSCLRGNPEGLRQVLDKLLDNALKFTHRGQVTVRVRPESVAELQTTLRFEITDTGIGFAPERAASLFDPFVQADGSSTRAYGGMGLGLAIARQLVEWLGGSIGVESKLGSGSTFFFTATFERQNARVDSGVA